MTSLTVKFRAQFTCSFVTCIVTVDSGSRVTYISDVHCATFYNNKCVLSSDHMVRLPLFWDRISNCTNLFRPKPNRTRHRIFTFVSLLFGNCQNAALVYLPFDDVTDNIDQTLELTWMSIVCSVVILYAKYLAKMLCTVWRRNKKCSETGPKRCYSGGNSTSTCSGTISNVQHA